MNAVALTLAWVIADPPPGDGWRIPPITYLRAGIDFNRAYRRHLWRQAESDREHAWYYRAVGRETDALYRVWDDAWGAHPEYTCTPEQKREYLRRFRLALGREAYYRMELPPCAPYHRFHQLRR